MSNVVRCSAVSTHKTPATHQITRAQLPYLHTNDLHPNVTKLLGEKSYVVPVHNPVQCDIHTQFVLWRYLFYN
jgi:hypothetical protein